MPRLRTALAFSLTRARTTLPSLMEIAEMTAPQRLKRRAWTGTLLRFLGHASWAAEQTPSGSIQLGCSARIKTS